MASAETLQIALRLLPETEHVVVVGGVAAWDREQEALARQQLKRFIDHVDITYMTDMAVPELFKRLKHLPRHTVVILLSFARDAEGTGFKSNEIAPLVAAAANAPVFSLYDVYLGHGEVGGYLSNLGEQGRVAGGMALEATPRGKAAGYSPGQRRKHLHVRLASGEALGLKRVKFRLAVLFSTGSQPSGSLTSGTSSAAFH